MKITFRFYLRTIAFDEIRDQNQYCNSSLKKHAEKLNVGLRCYFPNTETVMSPLISKARKKLKLKKYGTPAVQ